MRAALCGWDWGYDLRVLLALARAYGSLLEYLGGWGAVPAGLRLRLIHSTAACQSPLQSVCTECVAIMLWLQSSVRS